MAITSYHWKVHSNFSKLPSFLRLIRGLEALGSVTFAAANFCFSILAVFFASRNFNWPIGHFSMRIEIYNSMEIWLIGVYKFIGRILMVFMHLQKLGGWIGRFKSRFSFSASESRLHSVSSVALIVLASFAASSLLKGSIAVTSSSASLNCLASLMCRFTMFRWTLVECHSYSNCAILFLFLKLV